VARSRKELERMGRGRHKTMNEMWTQLKKAEGGPYLKLHRNDYAEGEGQNATTRNESGELRKKKWKKQLRGFADGPYSKSNPLRKGQRGEA